MEGQEVSGITLEGKDKAQELREIITVLKKVDPDGWRDLLLSIVSVNI